MYWEVNRGIVDIDQAMTGKLQGCRDLCQDWAVSRISPAHFEFRALRFWQMGAASRTEFAKTPRRRLHV